MLTKLTKLTSLLSLIAAVAGCAAETGTEQSFEAERVEPAIMPAHEMSLVVAFVNDPATNLALLDHEVGLERRAAQNIITHRDGADGVYPSKDDDPFDSIEELDAVPYVGETAMRALRAYAVNHAPPPAELVEGVQFTSAQVKAVVWGVNHASLTELDDEVGLVRQAAEGLIANAPYTTVTAIGAVPYVGPAALSALRSRAVVWAAQMNQGSQAAAGQAGTYDGVTFDEQTAQIALGIANTASYDQLTSNGMYGGGARAIIDSRPHSTLAHVAGSYGVGPSTMQALHAYASSGL
jgi:DNA uptake protein ComE-like DNA-binding protein